MNNIFYTSIVLTTFYTLIRCDSRYCFMKFYYYGKSDSNETNLKLTPYIESGKIEDAQSKALVNLEGFEDVKSYAGYFTVNQKYDSNLFFWYFVAEQEPKNAPVILWLQGGPGVASTYGIFYENGPFEYKNDLLTRRYYSWHKKYHMIYIDNPVGTGYSYTDGGYAQNQTAIGNDLYNALIQYFKLFPDLKNNDFYIAGESYAGKYIPAVSYAIHKNNNNNNDELKINLKGFAIGNGFTHPIAQIPYADHLYKIGYIDDYQSAILKKDESQIIDAINNEKWEELLSIWSNYLQIKDNFLKVDFYNHIMRDSSVYKYEEIYKIILSPKILRLLNPKRKSIMNDAYKVMMNLKEELTQSMANVFSELLSHYKALIYNGQLDLQVAHRRVEDYLMNLTFSGCEEFRKNKQKKWTVDGELAGYVKNGGNLTVLLVRNAGHSVPIDQPKWAMDFMEKFIKNELF